MLNVYHYPERPQNEGQYYVELLTRPEPIDDKHCLRLGYYCDKGHLEHMIRALLRPFGYDYNSAQEVLEGPPDTSKKQDIARRLRAALDELTGGVS